jgi:uncharacterized membrane protein
MFDLITLHPKLVHFPIAMIYLAIFFEFLFLFYKKEYFGMFSIWLFYRGLIAAFMAAFSGLLSENTLGHGSPNHEEIHTHRNWMLATLVLWMIVALAGFFRRKSGRIRKYFIAALLAVMTLLTIGVDKGGKLVYEYGVGVNPKIIIEMPGSIPGHSDHVHEHSPTDQN